MDGRFAELSFELENYFISDDGNEGYSLGSYSFNTAPGELERSANKVNKTSTFPGIGQLAFQNSLSSLFSGQNASDVCSIGE